MALVYLVEDEVDLADLVEKYLVNSGYRVEKFFNGEDALKAINDNADLWILDIMLPGTVNGYDLIRKIRDVRPNVPVIFTSARDQDIDRVLGLELGSDDYISKPYSPRELMLRVKNALAHSKPLENKINKVGPYVIDLESRKVSLGQEEISLTSKEFDLLALLFKNPGQAFSREHILQEIWGSDYDGSDRVVDDLMRRLRQKMSKLRVETVYGFGYRLS